MFSPPITPNQKVKKKLNEIQQQQKFTLQTSHEMVQIKDGQTPHDRFSNCYEARALSV